MNKLHANKTRGFSLIEVMIVVAISAILATIMYSTYINHVRQSRRLDAMQTLLSIQLAQEQYRTNNTTYGTIGQVWGGITKTNDGYYNLTFSNLTATSYTLTATANSDQASDSQDGTSCGTLSLSMSNGTETKSPAECWR